MKYVRVVVSYRIATCKCMHLVRRGHFSARDKDGGHAIGYAIFENTMLHANLMALSFTEPELWLIKVYIAGIGIFELFAPVTLTFTSICELDPYCLEIYRMCKYELPTSWLSKVTPVV